MKFRLIVWCRDCFEVNPNGCFRGTKYVSGDLETPDEARMLAGELVDGVEHDWTVTVERHRGGAWQPVKAAA